MNKTWKERLYDVSRSQFVVRYIPGLLFGLALLSIVCCFLFGNLFNWMLLSTILYDMFYLLPIIGFGLQVLFDAVRSYNKATFCCNKIRNSLLANEWFIFLVLSWTLDIVLIVVANIIFGVDSYGFRVTTVIGVLLVVALSYVISKPFSKHFKKKIVYIENGNSNVKDN